jgi:hypothetical protein
VHEHERLPCACLDRAAINDPALGNTPPVEVEVQFVYKGSGPLVVPILLADLELRRSSAVTLVDTYFDTESLELRRAGCSLRIRRSDANGHFELTFKGPSRKRRKVKRRHESEFEIDQLPADGEELLALLRDSRLDDVIPKVAGVELEDAPHAIGELRNRRSRHVYRHGLHRLDLTWDELEFPSGPAQTRLEVEARTKPAERLVDRAAKELRELLGDELGAPGRGKTRELCERLYPELLAA